MAWTESSWSRQYFADNMDDTADMDLDTDSIKYALYDNDITPDPDATAANYAYNAGQWTSSGNEVFEAGQWAQGGVVLAAADVTTPSSQTVRFDANDAASGSAADLANVFGGFAYDDTITTPVADQGILHNYFGGSNGVTNGTFTVIFASTGLGQVLV